MTTAAVNAVAADREALIGLAATFTAEEWQAPSDCAGWSVQDVIAHMATVFIQISDPSSLPAPDPSDVERTADANVALWRGKTPAEVLEGYVAASTVGLDTLTAMQAPEMLDVVVPLANLGTHPVHLLADALAFDHYTHIRVDLLRPLGPLDRTAPPSDELRLAPTVGWMLAGLPQMCRSELSWLRAPVDLVLDGPGAGEHHLVPGVDGIRLESGRSDAAVSGIRSSTADFVVWGTKRRDWRTLTVSTTGDQAVATRVLDAVNVI